AMRGRSDAALVTVERARARALLDVIGRAAALPIDDIRAALPPRVGLLYFAAAKDRLLAWIVTRSGLEHTERAIGAAALASLVDAHEEALSAGDAGAERRASAA